MDSFKAGDSVTFTDLTKAFEYIPPNQLVKESTAARFAVLLCRFSDPFCLAGNSNKLYV